MSIYVTYICFSHSINICISESIFSTVVADFSSLIFPVFKFVLSFHNQILNPSSSLHDKTNWVHPSKYFVKISRSVSKILDFTCYYLLRIPLQVSQLISMLNLNRFLLVSLSPTNSRTEQQLIIIIIITLNTLYRRIKE